MRRVGRVVEGSSEHAARQSLFGSAGRPPLAENIIVRNGGVDVVSYPALSGCLPNLGPSRESLGTYQAMYQDLTFEFPWQLI